MTDSTPTSARLLDMEHQTAELERQMEEQGRQLQELNAAIDAHLARCPGADAK